MAINGCKTAICQSTSFWDTLYVFLIRNLHFFPFFKRSTYVDTFHNWGTAYKIEFDIKINGPIAGADLNGYVNIFHMSTLKPGESETGTLYILGQLNLS